jgi:Xaa-Pro aminopeptidase
VENVEHTIAISGNVMHADLIKEKMCQAKALMQEFHIDCWITFVRETSAVHDPILDFLVSSDLTWQSALIITRSGPSIAIVGNYDRQTLVDAGAFDRVVGYVEGIRQSLLAELQALKPRTIALNYSIDSEICDGITHGMYLSMMSILHEAGLDGGVVPAEDLISALRQRKTSSEVACIREAIRHTEEMYAQIGGIMRSGMTEEGIAAIMHAEVQKRGLGFAWDPQVCPSVYTGPETATAHYRPTDRVLHPGHVVTMDFGVRVGGYVSDIQRTFYVLRKGESTAPPAVQQGFDTIVASIEKACAMLKPGVTGLEVDAAARSHITTAGYSEFSHGLGHQVGRFAHDGTALLGPAWEKYGRKPFCRIEEGMVFTIEPSLSIPGHGAVSIEEMVVVTSRGAEYLSVPQLTLRYVH